MTASTVNALQPVPADDLDTVDGGIAPLVALGAIYLVCGTGVGFGIGRLL